MQIIRNDKPPSETRGAPRKYPWDDLNVGDCLIIPCAERERTVRSSVYRSAKQYGVRITTKLINGKTELKVWVTGKQLL